MLNNNPVNQLRAKNIGVDTYQENIVFMRHDCDVCKSEGFKALTRVVVKNGERQIIATLNVVTSDILSHHEAGLSNEALRRLGARNGDTLTVSHLSPVQSFRSIRAKMFGKKFTEQDLVEIMGDIVAGRYSNIELASFVTTCVNSNLALEETIGLTKAMISVGKRLHWGSERVMDKHCVGGLPGNRTTPIVVSIVAASGLVIPKTSSRAITSPAGTADTMESMAPVNLSIEEMKKVVEQEGACIAWGGSVQLSPADDVIISVEKALDIDSESQMIASVLSKKAAAGSTHVLIDIPVGDTAKVRSTDAAQKLQSQFEKVGEAVGLQVRCIITDGTQPIGRGIGPSLEALDVLGVLKNDPAAPSDLKQRALTLAGHLLELGGKAESGKGKQLATEILESGKASEKFLRICEAQGGFRMPSRAGKRFDVLADRDGIVAAINNRTLAKIAKLAGAPNSPASGIEFYAPLGKHIRRGDLLYTIYSETDGELLYALEFANSIEPVITIS